MHDVFISHSSKDGAIAEAVYATLEAEGVKCWISSRHIPYGMDWSEAIMNGIGKCRIVLLIYTQHASESWHVNREVQLAYEFRAKVIPVRFENCEPSKKMQFYITGVQWFDAFPPPIEQHVTRLAGEIRRLLANEDGSTEDPGGLVDGTTRGGTDPDRNEVIEVKEEAGLGRLLGRARKRFWLTALAALACTAIIFAWSSFLQNGVESPALGDHISFGEEIIRRGNPETEMKSGVGAYARGDYELAVEYFEAAWRKTKNQEGLIYLNNARLALDKTPSSAIAVVIPVSRTGGLSGDEILKGIAQAQREINERQGRIKNGVGLRIAVASDVFGEDNDFGRAKEVAGSLVGNPEILGVIGHYSSDVTKEVIPIYDGRKALISPTSTSEYLIDRNSNPRSQFIFRTVYQDSQTAEVLAGFVISRTPWRNAAVFYAKGSNYPESLLKQFRTTFKKMGGRIAEECVFDLGVQDFVAETVLDQAKAGGAEVLVFFPNSKTVANAFLLLDKGRSPAYSNFKLKLSGDSMGYDDTLQRGKTTDGLISVVPWHWQSNANTPYFKDAKELWPGHEVVWQMALSYDAVMAFSAALANRQPASAGAVQLELASDGFKAAGATGEIRFDGGNRVGLNAQLVRVEPFADSPGNYHFASFAGSVYADQSGAANGRLYGVIEVGSSGIRSLVRNYPADGVTSATTLVAFTPREVRALEPAAVEKAVASVKELVHLMTDERHVDPSHIHIIGSSGAAEGKMAAALKDRITSETRIAMKFIDVKNEVRLTLKGLTKGGNMGDLALIDIGGGNAKAVYYKEIDGRWEVDSVRLGDGVRTITEKASPKYPLVDDNLAQYLQRLAALRTNELEPGLISIVNDKPAFARRPILYLTGGISWVMASAIDPPDRKIEDGDAVIELPPAEIAAWLETALHSPGRAQLFNGTGMTGEALRIAGENQAKIESNFSPAQIAAGATILKAVQDCLGFTDRRKILFDRDSMHSWLGAYLDEVVLNGGDL